MTLDELFGIEDTTVVNAVGPLTADMVLTIDDQEPTDIVVRGNLRALENVRTDKPVYNKEI
ncbi:MAG: hypothetical protein IIA67_12760, partial [Planctomycetes bacterium]|nr:hypothetical protein [Planctomycetota bacterium]